MGDACGAATLTARRRRGRMGNYRARGLPRAAKPAFHGHLPTPWKRVEFWERNPLSHRVFISSPACYYTDSCAGAMASKSSLDRGLQAVIGTNGVSFSLSELWPLCSRRIIGRAAPSAGPPGRRMDRPPGKRRGKPGQLPEQGPEQGRGRRQCLVPTRFPCQRVA